MSGPLSGYTSGPRIHVAALLQTTLQLMLLCFNRRHCTGSSCFITSVMWKAIIVLAHLPLPAAALFVAMLYRLLLLLLYRLLLYLYLLRILLYIWVYRMLAKLLWMPQQYGITITSVLKEFCYTMFLIH